MSNRSKGTMVMAIGDGITTPLNVQYHAILEDTWITETDKVLYDEFGNVYNVLDFQEIEVNVLEMPSVMPYHNGWCIKKRSCVLLDKGFSVGDIFYTDNRDIYCVKVIHHTCKHFKLLTGCNECKIKKFEQRDTL